LLPQPVAALYEDYREPKNVVLSSLFGGISHIKGAFEVAVILRSRGHNITYITSDNQVKLAKPYAFPTISIGLTSFEADMRGKGTMGISFFAYIKEKIIDASYEHDYLRYKEIFAEIKPDIVVCDIFATACVDASFMAGIPFAILEMMILSSDAPAPYINSMLSTEPTSMHQTLLQRIDTNFIQIAKILYCMYPGMVALNKKRARVGVPPVWGMDSRWRDSYISIQTPRPLGPLVHVIGPVMARRLRRIRTKCLARLALPQRPSHCARLFAPSRRDLIWAIVQTQSTEFPATILVPNGDPIAAASLTANEHPDFHFTTWAPQFAVLNHTSTRLFISHSGAESAHEALYTGTPLLLQPYFGDQPANTAKLVSAGVALRINPHSLTVTEVADSIRCLVEDASGQFAVNIKRMKALAQIGSHRVARGADVLEEVMFGSVNRNKSIHLYSPDKEMTWYKAGNYDLYFVVVVGLGGLVYGVGKVMMFAVKNVVNRGIVKVKQA
ncbi:hypothetical protein BC937DRAFT_95402, partial [Endogone sp. FLAS-F59071]